jgi:hypothetical protein
MERVYLGRLCCALLLSDGVEFALNTAFMFPDSSAGRCAPRRVLPEILTRRGCIVAICCEETTVFQDYGKNKLEVVFYET